MGPCKGGNRFRIFDACGNMRDAGSTVLAAYSCRSCAPSGGTDLLLGNDGRGSALSGRKAGSSALASLVQVLQEQYFSNKFGDR